VTTKAPSIVTVGDVMVTPDASTVIVTEPNVMVVPLVLVTIEDAVPDVVFPINPLGPCAITAFGSDGGRVLLLTGWNTSPERFASDAVIFGVPIPSPEIPPR
jgi:hypothetical protein